MNDDDGRRRWCLSHQDPDTCACAEEQDEQDEEEDRFRRRGPAARRRSAHGVELELHSPELGPHFADPGLERVGALLRLAPSLLLADAARTMFTLSSAVV